VNNNERLHKILDELQQVETKIKKRESENRATYNLATRKKLLKKHKQIAIQVIQRSSLGRSRVDKEIENRDAMKNMQKINKTFHDWHKAYKNTSSLRWLININDSYPERSQIKSTSQKETFVNGLKKICSGFQGVKSVDE